jgi:hypothetical protein
MVVYHYTSHESLLAIINSNDFHPSYLNPQMDTAFGEGWYFTDLHPDTTPDEDLQQSLWMRAEPTKSKRYLAFEIDDSLLQFCRPNVYRLKMESISERIIKLSLIYTFTSSGIQAIKFLNHGRKQIVYKPFNPWKTFSVIALVGIGLWAITK